MNTVWELQIPAQNMKNIINNSPASHLHEKPQLSCHEGWGLVGKGQRGEREKERSPQTLPSRWHPAFLIHTLGQCVTQMSLQPLNTRLNEAASCDGDAPACPIPFAWEHSPTDTADAEPRWDDTFPPFPPPTAWPPWSGCHHGHPEVGKEACLLPPLLLWQGTHLSLHHTCPNSAFLRKERWCGQWK